MKMVKITVQGDVYEAGGVAHKGSSHGSRVVGPDYLAKLLNSVREEHKIAQMIVVGDEVWVMKVHKEPMEVEVPEMVARQMGYNVEPEIEAPRYGEESQDPEL